MCGCPKKKNDSNKMGRREYIFMSPSIYLNVCSLQTINDVVLGVTQAGLSRYLNKRYGKKYEL